MIYLIGGAPRCGKTLLAQRLALKKRLFWISTDTIRQMVVAATPKQQLIKKFPYNKLQQEQRHGPYRDINFYPPSILLRAEITESRSLWPSIRALITDFHDTGRSGVIEGVHLLPSYIHQLTHEFPKKDLRILYLVKEDLPSIQKGFLKNQSDHDWLSGALEDRELLEKVAQMVRIKSRYVQKEATKYNLSVIDTSKHFTQKLSLAYDQLL